MKPLVKIRRIVKDVERFIIGQDFLAPIGNLEKSIREEVSEEYLEDTLQMLLVRGRNLLFSEIPELNSEEYIYIDLDAKPKENKDIITSLISQSRGALYEFLNKEKPDTKNIFTPALLFEKLFVFINDSKIELFKLNEMYKNLFREENLEKVNVNNVFYVDILKNNKKESFIITEMIDSIYKMINENRRYSSENDYISKIEELITLKLKGSFKSSDLTELIKFFNLHLEAIKKEVIFNKYRLLKEKEELHLYLEMNEKIGVYKDEEILVLSRESSNIDIITDSVKTIAIFMKEDDSFYKPSTILSIYRNLNHSISEHNVILKHTITPFHWVLKTYEILYYDTRIKYDGLRLSSKEIYNMVLDIKNHPFISDEWEDMTSEIMDIKESNIFKFIKDNSSLFKEVLKRAIDWFFNIYYFDALIKESTLFSIPNRITLKNFEYINEYKEMLMNKDLYEKQKEMGKVR